MRRREGRRVHRQSVVSEVAIAHEECRAEFGGAARGGVPVAKWNRASCSDQEGSQLKLLLGVALGKSNAKSKDSDVARVCTH